MSDLFALSMPWWEFVLRVVVVYAAVLLMVRLSGKHTIGRFTPFDRIGVVLLANAGQTSLIGSDSSLLGELLLAATLVALNWVAGFVTARSAWGDRLVEGAPGSSCCATGASSSGPASPAPEPRGSRRGGAPGRCARLEDVALAVRETNGRISVIRRSGA
jgi:uncharacterized membrane protein YcaP (DUF421 family)